MPNTVKEIIWDEYYRYSHNNRNFSAFSYILGNDSLRLAFWLLLLLFLLIYLFESKRRQRQVPVITPLRNTSLDFVRTIGRLYYQRRDNHNLATKMVVHFQDQGAEPLPSHGDLAGRRLCRRLGLPDRLSETRARTADRLYAGTAIKGIYPG